MGAVSLAAMSPSIHAAQAYTPDIGTFTGKDDSIVLPPDDRLEIAGGGTIEFWVSAGWTKDPGYDPVVIANAGPQGPSYMIFISGERDAIGVAVGDKVEMASFNFDDTRQHFVAVSDFGGEILLSIDNQPVATLPLGFAALPSSGLFIGSADGVTAPFTGKISGLRIWDTAVEPDVLAIYALNPLVGANGSVHPDIDSLVGVSVFDKRGFALAASSGQ